MNDAAIDAAVEAGIAAQVEPDGRGKLHVAYRKLLDSMTLEERVRAQMNLERRLEAKKAQALLADKENPGNEGKRADAALKADEATRRMDARQGYQRPATGFVSGPVPNPPIPNPEE